MRDGRTYRLLPITGLFGDIVTRVSEHLSSRKHGFPFANFSSDAIHALELVVHIDCRKRLQLGAFQ
jgi:hypothetical protein